MIAAVFISIMCHIFCFASLEPTFGKVVAEGSEFSGIFFLGPILEKSDYYYCLQSNGHTEDSRHLVINSGFNRKNSYLKSRLNVKIIADMLRVRSYLFHESNLDLINFNKPAIESLINNKITYLQPLYLSTIKKSDSSIMFYPQMPYHFLLYFKDRQAAHVEIAFYISSKGKIVGIKRKVSSGNPEVDLLIMRNLTHFLNLCKSNFVLDSWRTVKIDLSP